jgi:hypothetical protein
MRTAMLIAAAVSTFGASSVFAADLTCSATAGGPSFQVAEVTEAPAAAVKARGAERCDIVYRIDGSRYELGGCNRESVALWSPTDGAPIGHQHGRLLLVCR